MWWTSNQAWVSWTISLFRSGRRGSCSSRVCRNGVDHELHRCQCYCVHSLRGSHMAPHLPIGAGSRGHSVVGCVPGDGLPWGAVSQGSQVWCPSTRAQTIAHPRQPPCLGRWHASPRSAEACLQIRWPHVSPLGYDIIQLHFFSD